MRRYELMLLFRPDLEDDKLQAAVEKVTRAIVNAGGTLTKVSPWGKRRLAYQITHFREASYFLLHFDIAPSAIRELERGMLISEEILRHLVTVIEDRGPIDEDEIPPAAVARDDRADDEADADSVESASGEAAPRSTATAVGSDGDSAADQATGDDTASSSDTGSTSDTESSGDTDEGTADEREPASTVEA